MAKATRAQLLALLDDARGLIEDAMYTHIYDESNGDEPDEDCAYSAFVKEAEAVLAAENPPPPVKPVERLWAVTFTYQTKGGNEGFWSGEVEVTDDQEVFEVASKWLYRERGRHIAGKLVGDAVMIKEVSNG